VISKTAMLARVEILILGRVEVADEVIVIFPDERRSPPRVIPEALSWEAEIPPVNVDVPDVSTSKVPVIVRDAAAISVEERDGIVEVAEDVWVIFPDERRRSPPVNVIPWADENPPDVVTSTPPANVEVPDPRTSRVVVEIISPVLIESSATNDPSMRVEVAATENPAPGVVVPIPRLPPAEVRVVVESPSPTLISPPITKRSLISTTSVVVCCRMIVPVSVNPEIFPVSSSVPQRSTPLPSVSIVSQFVNSPILILVEESR